ncbi:arylsulfatase B-like, partial [Asbolus verrucosus]
GWNDVGFHGSNQIPTPNIDALAYNGIILNSHYGQSFGTPSLTALLTGKYPMRLGMQGPSITPAEERALPEGKIFPEYFKEMGYETHLVGKWHMGHSRWNDTPTFRGFDHFFGYYNGFTSYYDYVSNWKINGKDYSGFDLRRDTNPSWFDAGKYATDLFTEYATDVIQNHDINTSRVSTDLMHITDWLPTIFTGAGGDIGLLDPELDGIDQWSSLVYDLPSARNDILLNIDEKTRNAALRFSYWKLIVGTSGNGTYNGYFGAPLNENIDEQPYNTTAINDSPVGRIAKRISYNPLTDSDFEILRRSATLKCLDAKGKKNYCDPASGAVCLYDIPNDPCEENDLAKYFPSVVRRIKRTLVDYRKGLVPQIETTVDIENADPKLYRYTWNPWRDCAD